MTILSRCRIPAPVLLALILLTATGCERNGRPQTYPVRGKVTLDGKSVEFGDVRFLSDDGRVATGKIQSDGSYRMGTAKWGDGVLPGNYRVTVQVREMMEDPSEMFPGRSGPSQIPEKYEQPETSGLQFEVAEGKDRFDIELSSKP